MLLLLLAIRDFRGIFATDPVGSCESVDFVLRKSPCLARTKRAIVRTVGLVDWAASGKDAPLC